MTAHRVSAIIPAFNSATFLKTAVDSALNQTQPAHEVIVVDDASTDATREILDSYGDRIVVARHEQNLGLPSARNTGIRVANGDMLGFLDADDAWLPDMIAAQDREFAHHLDLGLCYSSLIDCDESLRPVSPPRHYRRRECEMVFEELYMRAFPMPPSTVFVRRAVIESVGCFDETMLMKQDYECWLRIAMLHPVSCLPEPLCLRRTHGDSLTGIRRLQDSMVYEARCFDLCGFAANRQGISLPMPVRERQILSKKRRVHEYLLYGDVEAATVYRSELARLQALSPLDRAGFAALSVRAAILRLLRQVLQA